MQTIRAFSPCLIACLLLAPACGVSQVPQGPTPSDGGSETDDGEEAEETGDGDGDGDGTTFVIPPDSGTKPACDPWAQDCPEGEKCVAYSPSGSNWEANTCVPISGDGQIGDPCSYSGTIDSIDDCGADSFCWNVNPEGMGVCTPFCEGTADNPLCGANEGCTIANEGSINLCLPTCDPILQDCEGGNVCFYDFSGDFVCTFAADMVLTGGACGFINDCAPGNVCLAAEVLPECDGATCCGAFCLLSDPTCEAVGTECAPFFEEGTAPPDYEDVGVCIIPGA